MWNHGALKITPDVNNLNLMYRDDLARSCHPIDVTFNLQDVKKKSRSCTNCDRIFFPKDMHITSLLKPSYNMDLYCILCAKMVILLECVWYSVEWTHGSTAVAAHTNTICKPTKKRECQLLWFLRCSLLWWYFLYLHESFPVKGLNWNPWSNRVGHL